MITLMLIFAALSKYPIVMLRLLMSEQLSKGDKFLKNCGTASVGEYNKEIYYYQRS